MGRKVPTYTIDHPYIKKHYPVIYNIFGGNEQGQPETQEANGGATPPTSTNGYQKYLEARQKLKLKLDTT